MDNKNIEQTFVFIKPDALKNSLTGYVLSKFSEFHTGLHFAGTRIVHVCRMLAEEHYAEHKGKVFYEPLLEYILGNLHYPGDPGKQRVIAIVYQGPNAVKEVRRIAGPTNPNNARNDSPGCIRSMGAVVPIIDDDGKAIGQRMDNLIHASATVEEAEREIKLWFRPTDIPPVMHMFPTEVCEEYYYFKEGKLFTEHVPGSICFLAPGNMVWKSDLEALQMLNKNSPAPCSLETVVAKYLVNES